MIVSFSSHSTDFFTVYGRTFSPILLCSSPDHLFCQKASLVKKLETELNFKFNTELSETEEPSEMVMQRMLNLL